MQTILRINNSVQLKDSKDRNIDIPLIFIFALLLLLIGFSKHFLFAREQGLPIPINHDEFAYLLSADTFSQGRLTNPPHPFWEHFQTFHVFFHPTYQAKYPPGQGIFLAIGQVFFDEPIWGAWISLALAYVAIFWFFLSDFKPFFAFISTLVIIFNPYINLLWAQSYWGGGVAMLGGGLFYGGISHSRIKVSFSNTIGFCIGLTVLANSRPFEGFIVFIISFPILVSIAIKGFLFEKRQEVINKFIVPICLTFLLIFIWIFYYNFKITGNPLNYFYLNWNYHSASINLIKEYQGSVPLSLTSKILRLWGFFIGPYLLIFFLMGIISILFKKDKIFELISIFILSTISILYTRAWPHYIAPITCLIYFIIFKGISETYKLKIIKSKKTKEIVVLFLIVFYYIIAYKELNSLVKKRDNSLRSNLHHRIPIIEKLNNNKEKDLIFVKYNKNHNIHMEWVYNSADIDNSDIIWAHCLGPEKDKAMINYYKNRKIWVLFPDRQPPELLKIKDADSYFSQ